MSVGIRRDSVGVHLITKGLWSVSIAGHADESTDEVRWTRITCAQFTTRRLANDYAKRLRKALKTDAQ